MATKVDFSFSPELRLVGGRIIRDLNDAIGFAREQEARPGVDQRDEVLHRLERAENEQQAKQAAEMFMTWLGELEILDARA